MVSKERGMIPFSCGSEGTPLIVKVLPVPVYPYAKMVPLYPCKTKSMIGYASSVNTVSCSELQSYTESKVNTLGTSSPGFYMSTSPVSLAILTTTSLLSVRSCSDSGRHLMATLMHSVLLDIQI